MGENARLSAAAIPYSSFLFLWALWASGVDFLALHGCRRRELPQSPREEKRKSQILLFLRASGVDFLTRCGYRRSYPRDPETQRRKRVNLDSYSFSGTPGSLGFSYGDPSSQAVSTPIETLVVIVQHEVPGAARDVGHEVRHITQVFDNIAPARAMYIFPIIIVPIPFCI